MGENSKGNYSSIIWKFIDSIRNKKKPIIYGDWKQRRGFIYVKDTARASVLAIRNGKTGEVYNIGNGNSVDFNSVFNVVKEETGYEGDAVYVPNSLKNYKYFTETNVSKTNSELKFSSEYDLRRGIREILDSTRFKR